MAKSKKEILVPEGDLDMFSKHGVKSIKMGSKTLKLVKRKRKK